MAKFNMFKIPLFLLLMLLFTAAVTQQNHKVTVRAGDDVTLPCENRKDFNDSCHNTTWIFSNSGINPAVTLFEHGQVHKEAGSKSDRLSVTEDCSLVIKKVTAEDDGLYTCRQFNASGQQVSDSYVQLTVNNREDTTKATPSTTGKLQSTETTSTTDRGKETTATTVMVIIMAVGGFTVFLIIMAVIGWKIIKRNKTQKNENIELSDDYYTEPETRQDRVNSPYDVSYITISHTKNNNKTFQDHSKHGNCDAVTYSNIQISYSSAGASTDDSNNYSYIENI